jgi:hypothetical protein
VAKRIPKNDTDKARVANFDTKGNLPQPWWIVGQNLLASSDLLGRALVLDTPAALTEQDAQAFRMDARVRGATLMLRGCAVECLLKALYVAAGNVLARDGDYIRPPGVADHDLIRLAQAAGFLMSAAERSLLKLLSYWIKQGRYPLMANWAQRPSFSRDEKALAVNWDAECEELWSRLLERFGQEGRRLRERLAVAEDQGS